MGEEPVIRGLDTFRAGASRPCGYWLGGDARSPAGRKLAATLPGIVPGISAVHRGNRAFISRAVAWAAGHGIARFLDLGAGPPAHPAVHECAQAVIPGARVAYVDNDPVVVLHIAALLTSGVAGSVAAVRADLTEPETVLSHPDVAAVAGRGKPFCVILGAVLHLHDATAARRITAGYIRRMPPGSIMVISCGHGDHGASLDAARDRSMAAAWHNHSPAEIGSFFGGLNLVPPGLVLAPAWRGGPAAGAQRPAGPGYVLGGVGVKP